MERDGKPEASEEAGERDRDLNSHQVLMAGRPIPAVATGWNNWAIILDWPESPVGWGGGAGGSSEDAGALGCFPSGSYSSALGQPVGVPALALPVTSCVSWTWYLGASVCPLENTGIVGVHPLAVVEESRS